MSVSPATMTVSRPAEGVAVIGIHGDVTSACEEALLRAHEEASDAGTELVVLDFADMAYMNSGGIGMLVTLLVRGRRRRQRIAAIGLMAHYREIFRLTRLDEAIALYEDLPAATAG